MRLVRAVWFVIFASLPATIAAGCDRLDEFTSPASSNGPRNRSAKHADAQCYETFAKFKAEMARIGRSQKNAGKQWHHIVPQHAANVKQFGAFDLHCTDNLIYIEASTHRLINAHYSSAHSSRGTVRDWLKGQDFDTQFEYDVEVLRQHRIEL